VPQMAAERRVDGLREPLVDPDPVAGLPLIGRQESRGAAGPSNHGDDLFSDPCERAGCTSCIGGNFGPDVSQRSSNRPLWAELGDHAILV
jgi:hypothetical protein